MSFLRKYWQGKRPLWEAFWVWGVLAQILIHVSVYFIAPQIIFSARLVLFIIFIIYSLWNIVSIYRCSFNSGYKKLARILRGLIILIAAIYTAALVIIIVWRF